jgi:NitT/TauT family transport system substrate-binding protein
MRPPTRALVLSLAVVLLAAPTEGAGSPVRVTVAQALDSVDFLLLYVARHLNTFQEEGLDARFIVMAGGGGPNLAAVLSGEAQFTASGLFTFLGPIRGGQPLVAVRSLFDGMSVNFVIRRDVATRLAIREGMPVAEKYRKLRGLTIGITRPGALTDYVARFVLALAGLRPGEDVRLLGVGTGPAALAALEAGRVDIVAHVSPVPEQAVARGTGVMLFNNTRGEIPELREFLGLALVTTWPYVRQNGETVRRMNRALTRAALWFQKVRDREVARVLLRFMPDVDEDVMESVVANNRSRISLRGVIRESSVLMPQKLLVQLGVETQVVEFRQIATNEYLR